MPTICLHIGRLQEARIAHEQAQRSNPKTRSGNLESFYLMSGDFARAEEAGEAWLRDEPGAMYALFFHPLPPLLRAIWRSPSNGWRRLAATSRRAQSSAFKAFCTPGAARPGSALECVRKALELPRSFGHTHHTYYQIACVYAVLGDTDKAMAWLERSVDTGFACWPFFRADPHLENLREKAEFARLVGDLEHR